MWPGATHFPDFFNPKGRDYFARQLRQHHGMVPWDGIWWVQVGVGVGWAGIGQVCTGALFLSLSVAARL